MSHRISYTKRNEDNQWLSDNGYSLIAKPVENLFQILHNGVLFFILDEWKEKSDPNIIMSICKQHYRDLKINDILK